jgi:ABC-type uncharacterized transport system, permease component
MDKRAIISPLISIAIAFAIGAIFIKFIGKSPLEAYASIFKGAFAGEGWGFTLFSMTSLIITGLAVALGFHCGLFNIGANGQLMVGGMFAAYIALLFSGVPAFLLLPVVIFSAIAAGGFWGFIPGFLKSKRGTNEVVVTIMMNYIAIGMIGYLLTYPLKASPGWIAQSEIIPESLWLPRYKGMIGADPTIILAIALAVMVYFLLWRTKTGYEIRAVGFNPKASNYGGINVPRTIALAMALSGAIAGLAYFNYIFAYQHRVVSDVLLGANVGFDGITVALLGKNHPLGIILASFLLAVLCSGCLAAQFEIGIPKSFYLFLEGIIIFSFVIFEKVMGGRKE